MASANDPPPAARVVPEETWLSAHMSDLDELFNQHGAHSEFRFATVAAMLFALVAATVVVCGDRFGPIFPNDATGSEVWAEDGWRRSAGIGHLVAIPFVAIPIAFLTQRTLSTILWWQPHVKRSASRPSRTVGARVTSVWPGLLLGGVCVIVQGYAACLQGLRDDLHPFVRFYFRLVRRAGTLTLPNPNPNPSSNPNL